MVVAASVRRARGEIAIGGDRWSSHWWGLAATTDVDVACRLSWPSSWQSVVAAVVAVVCDRARSVAIRLRRPVAHRGRPAAEATTAVATGSGGMEASSGSPHWIASSLWSPCRATAALG